MNPIRLPRLIGFVSPILLLSFTGLQLQAAAAERFVQDRLVIGFWVGPQDRSNVEQRYQEIADANFTLAVGIPPADVPICGRLGLKAIVDAGQKPEAIPDHTACWGSLLMDEPGAAQFPELAKRAAEVRERRPGRFGYINLFPNYANAGQLGTPTYEEHVARFVREVQPEVLSMDHYPLMSPKGDTRASYCENLEVFRTQSLAAKIPFWNYFYSMPFNDRLDPTEAPAPLADLHLARLWSEGGAVLLLLDSRQGGCRGGGVSQGRCHPDSGGTENPAL